MQEQSNPTTDAKGRTIPAEMTDREIAEETLLRLRNFDDVLEGIAANPMMRAMMPGMR